MGALTVGTGTEEFTGQQEGEATPDASLEPLPKTPGQAGSV